jgi:hypothetical protein
VDETLELMGGTLNMASGTISLSSNAWIIVSGGMLTASGGVTNLTNAYNVRYTGSSATTGLELSGSGLTNIDISVPSTSSVTLASDLNVKGNLILNSGMLVLNGNDLNFSGSGNVAAGGTGTISATSGSDISITSTGTFGGGLRFTSGSNTVGNLTLNMGSGGMAMLASDLNVDGTLSLQSGTINIGGNNLTVTSNGSVSGGSSTSYVITGVGGRLTRSLTAGGSLTYNVGTTTRYAPAVMTGNTGSAAAMLSVGVNPSVYANGTSGTMLSTTRPVVDATWYVTSTASAGVNVNMQVMWSSNMEVNSFNRAKAYISHYTSGSWDANATTAATASGSMYAITRNNITSFSPFAVMNENTVGINNLTANNEVVLYPNPATSELHFSLKGKATHVSIYDVAGRTVKSIDISGGTNSIAVQDLAEGIYYAHFTGNGFKVVQKFTKQ